MSSANRSFIVFVPMLFFWMVLEVIPLVEVSVAQEAGQYARAK